MRAFVVELINSSLSARSDRIPALDAPGYRQAFSFLATASTLRGEPAARLTPRDGRSRYTREKRGSEPDEDNE
jgi:hypothetical protein